MTALDLINFQVKEADVLTCKWIEDFGPISNSHIRLETDDPIQRTIPLNTLMNVIIYFEKKNFLALYT